MKILNSNSATVTKFCAGVNHPFIRDIFFENSKTYAKSRNLNLIAKCHDATNTRKGITKKKQDSHLILP